MLDRYLERRARGDQQVADLLEMRPFTSLSGMTLMLAVVAAIIYLGVFTDSREELWKHLGLSAAVICLLSLIFWGFFRIEKKAPLPLRARRLLWWAIVTGYGALAMWLLKGLFEPYARTALVRAILSLGAILPLPFTAWQLLQKTKNG